MDLPANTVGVCPARIKFRLSHQIINPRSCDSGINQPDSQKDADRPTIDSVLMTSRVGLPHK